MQLSIGQSTTVSLRAIANPFYRNVALLSPVMIGDSLETSVTVAALADGSHQPARTTHTAALRHPCPAADTNTPSQIQVCAPSEQALHRAAPRKGDALHHV